MLHPLIQLIATRPQLVVEHAEAYAELAAAEVGGWAGGVRRQALQYALALCCLGAGLVLAGVALMLWAMLPMATSPAPWALLAVPGVPLLLAGACAWSASTPRSGTSFASLREQVRADSAMLHDVLAR